MLRWEIQLCIIEYIKSSFKLVMHEDCLGGKILDKTKSGMKFKKYMIISSKLRNTKKILCNFWYMEKLF